MKERRPGAARVRLARALALCASVACGVVLACGGTHATEVYSPRAGGPYRPGESIASARLCACSVCEERACCDGDDSLSPEHEPEFGLKLVKPCQCVRRVWTARGEEPCAALAGPECCPASISD